MAGFPKISGRSMLDSIDINASLFVPVGAFDVGLAIDAALVIIELNAVAIGSKENGLSVGNIVLVGANLFALVWKKGSGLTLQLAIDIGALFTFSIWSLFHSHAL